MHHRGRFDLIASRNTVLFLVMSLIWGGSWAAARIGLDGMPAIFFAAVRYAVSTVILCVAVRGWTGLYGREYLGRTLLTGLLVNAGCYGLLFWGMQTVPSGLAGLINLAVTPVALFALAIWVGDDRPSWRHAAAIATGLAGLIALFWGRLQDGGGMEEWPRFAAIIAGTLSYCAGSVLSRPLVQRFSPFQVTAAQVPIGMVGLAIASAAIEPIHAETWLALLRPAALGSLAYLVLAGTVAAYTIYMRLVRDWGTSRAGLYAFLSPVVALAFGHWLFGERIGATEITGAVLMLGASAIALRGRS
ncbi:MAG: EamA family transporter [Rubritepida sp.]|nr:EamA family transporter [Rubritepida sp.]